MKKNEIDMTSGNLFLKMFLYTLPIALSGMLQLFYNAADLIVCGQFGSEHSVAAISATNSLINLIIQLFLGLSVGANVLMARCFGSNNKEKGQRVVYTSMIFSVFFGIAVGVFGAIFSKDLLVLMKTTKDVIDLSSEYLFIYFLGLPFSMIYNFGASIMRATGDTKRPFYYLTIAGVVNVLLNLLFVIVFKMDVPGVALATICSQAVSATMVVIAMCKNQGFYHFSFKEIRLYKKEALEIAGIGLPAGLQGAIFSLSNVLIQSSVNSLGTIIMDANGSSSSLEGFVYQAIFANSQTCVAFISANYGAKKFHNIKKITLYGVSLMMIFWVVSGGIILSLHKPLLHLYIKNEEAVTVATQRLLIIVGTYFLCGLMDIFGGCLRGLGHSLTPTIVSLIGACGFRILWIYLVFPIKEMHNLPWLAASYPISWILVSLVNFSLFIVLFNKENKKYENSMASIN